MPRRTLSVALVCAAVSGCTATGSRTSANPGSQPQPTGQTSSNAAPTFAPELGVDLSQMTRTPSGLYLRDLREGTGEPVRSGQTVAVHYSGWLANGTRFDNSYDRDDPIDVALGEGRVIPGWEEGMVGMRVGGKRRLVIPPDLGYGDRAMGTVIPANSTLIFDIELVAIR